MSIMLSKTASSDPKSSWRRWASWPCLPSQHHLWPHGRECALKDASVKFDATTQSSHFGNFDLVSSQTGKKLTKWQQQRMTNWPTKQNDQQTKQNNNKKPTNKKNLPPKKQGSEVCQQICFCGPFHHRLDPFEADIANSGVCEQDAKPPVWLVFLKRGSFPPGGLAVGAAPFGKFLRETSKPTVRTSTKVDDESAKATKKYCAQQQKWYNFTPRVADATLNRAV